MKPLVKRRYRLYGRTIDSDLELAGALEGAGGRRDFALQRVEYLAGEAGELIYQSIREVAEGEPVLVVYRKADCLRLVYGGVGSFEIEARQITCCLSEVASHQAQVLFLGLVSSLWLEQAGAVCLHASAVVLPGGAVGFLGFNRAGKSSLAASFLAAGFPLLTDDVLAVERNAGRLFAQPSYPQMRLWPTTAGDFIENPEGLDPVYPGFEKRRIPVGGDGLGAFDDRPAALSALLLPERGEAEIAISPLSPREAMVELVRHSFLGALGEAAIGVGRRFERLVAVAERVPVFRLSYPNGLEHLPAVREAILERLSAL
jgi:hypothetical protein